MELSSRYNFSAYIAMCVEKMYGYTCTDICVKFCDYLWRDTQESDCPYGEKPGAWEWLPRQRELIFFQSLCTF